MLCAIAMAMAMAADAPLPELKTEAIDAGSVFRVKNTGSAPLKAYLIELVGYPGSFYMLWREESREPLAPGAERRIQVTNMTVGASPEYVKLQAALYADGTSSGVAERVALLKERRRFVVSTLRELIGRLEKGAAAGELKQWSDGLPPAGRAPRASQAVVNQTAGRELIGEAVALMESKGVKVAIEELKAREAAMGN